MRSDMNRIAELQAAATQEKVNNDVGVDEQHNGDIGVGVSPSSSKATMEVLKSQGICEAVLSQYCFDDYMQAMAMERGIKEGLGMQKDAVETGFLPADDHLSNKLNPLEYMREESGTFKMIRRRSSSAYEEDSCKQTKKRIKVEELEQECSLSLSLSWPPPVFSSWSGYSDGCGVNLELSMSICGS
ncbi:hypothetical protein J5N97_029003 [Dioscorea zingiberensis]|uniref:Uncharacterized protein n=1 Tax=Dioscorea zingiberensis TaxID=325984 RepID=A0A9D5C006_9LILI|nr:hypothetical protein J5N97_029003 [Dioscorea zingiberensis]